jgi:hypothetical protein
MVNIRETIEHAAFTSCMGFIDAGVSIKRGTLVVAGELSYIMYDIYSLEGFEKWTKATIANLKLLSLIPSIKGVFGKVSETLEAQMDIYYATLVFNSAADFVGEDDDGTLHFKLPRVSKKDGGGIDWVKILYAIANPLDTAKFAQKYQFYSFPLCTQLANRFGSCRVFNWTVNEIPVLNALCDKPKDFFVFWASLIEVNRCIWKENPFNLENGLKFAGSFGKMVLIVFGRHYNKKVWFVFAVAITQNSSLFARILKQRRERLERFNDPTKVK